MLTNSISRIAFRIAALSTAECAAPLSIALRFVPVTLLRRLEGEGELSVLDIITSFRDGKGLRPAPMKRREMTVYERGHKEMHS